MPKDTNISVEIKHSAMNVIYPCKNGVKRFIHHGNVSCFHQS